MDHTLQNQDFLLRFYDLQNLWCAQYYPKSAIIWWNFWCHTIFWEPFLDKKLCNLWRNERFGGSPKRVAFSSSFCAQKSCAFCEGLNVLGDKKSAIFAQFWRIFQFCTEDKQFKKSKKYICGFCMFTPIFRVRLRRHTLCECNLVKRLTFRDRRIKY